MADRSFGYLTRGQRHQLAAGFRRDLFSQRARSREKNGAGFYIVLRLRQHVGGQVPRIAVVTDDQNLGRPGDKVNANTAREQTLGRRHINIARPDDAIGARNGFGSEGECGDRVSPAEAEDF